jgi:hypothetical protein
LKTVLLLKFLLGGRWLKNKLRRQQQRHKQISIDGVLGEMWCKLNMQKAFILQGLLQKCLAHEQLVEL